MGGIVDSGKEPAPQSVPAPRARRGVVLVPPDSMVMTPDAPQRRHDRREGSKALRRISPTGSPWRSLPGDMPA